VGCEPFRRERRHLFQGAGLLEQVRGARHDRDLGLAVQLRQCLAVHADHGVIVATHHQECGGPHALQEGAGEIRPAAA
jgi:hypothetical protein